MSEPANHLMILLARPQTNAAQGGEMPDDGQDVRGLGAMAESLIHAIHGKDVQGTVDALKSFFEACDYDEGDEPEATPDGE